MTQKTKIRALRAEIWAFYEHSRREFTWRKTTNPYKILVSEVMLQQTQVGRVAGKYPEFLKAFPTVKTLAEAPLARVLAVWQGMGYNRRALALHRLAQEVMAKHRGKIPHARAELEALPSIGHYTAGAIRAFAFNEPEVFIETNIRRAFIHHFFSRRQSVSDKEILPLIEKTLDAKDPRAWYSALMDYGAHLPKIVKNPNKQSKHYTKQKPFEGSHRQVRGHVLKFLNTKGKCTAVSCARILEIKPEEVRIVLDELTREGFIQQHGKNYTIKN